MKTAWQDVFVMSFLLLPSCCSQCRTKLNWWLKCTQHLHFFFFFVIELGWFWIAMIRWNSIYTINNWLEGSHDRFDWTESCNLDNSSVDETRHWEIFQVKINWFIKCTVVESNAILGSVFIRGLDRLDTLKLIGSDGQRSSRVPATFQSNNPVGWYFLS